MELVDGGERLYTGTPCPELPYIVVPQKSEEDIWDGVWRIKPFEMRWAHQDSNLGPSDYESDALTD